MYIINKFKRTIQGNYTSESVRRAVMVILQVLASAITHKVPDVSIIG